MNLKYSMLAFNFSIGFILIIAHKLKTSEYSFVNQLSLVIIENFNSEENIYFDIVMINTYL